MSSPARIFLTIAAVFFVDLEAGAKDSNTGSRSSMKER